MGFEIIKAETRTANMIEWFSGICSAITDFLPGSKIRSKFEAIAVEMEAMDYAFYQAAKKAIPISIYQAFDFKLIPAQKASGEVVFTGTPTTTDIIIPAGTVVETADTTDSKRYTTTDQAIISLGSTQATARISCASAGVFGNTPAGTITRISTSILGVAGVTNSVAITNGTDREDEASRRQRFSQYVLTLTRGTQKAVEYAARSVALYDETGSISERISDAIVYEPFMHDIAKPVGVFECYIYNGIGGTSDEIKSLVENTINGYDDADGNHVPGWKAAGVICNVIKAIETTINVTATITIQAGYSASDTKTTATNVTDAYISGLGIGTQFIYNELVEQLMSIQGVYNVRITMPAADHAPAYNEVCILGTADFAVTTL